jgi:hypothetical protein
VTTTSTNPRRRIIRPFEAVTVTLPLASRRIRVLVQPLPLAVDSGTMEPPPAPPHVKVRDWNSHLDATERDLSSPLWQSAAHNGGHSDGGVGGYGGGSPPSEHATTTRCTQQAWMQRFWQAIVPLCVNSQVCCFQQPIKRMTMISNLNCKLPNCERMNVDERMKK